MKQLTSKCFVFAAILTAVLVSSACHKKAAQATPPPPPPPPAPTATLAANPAVIEQGQSTTLTWETNNATDVNIDGIGTVMAAGSKTVTPGSSTTYTLTAKGPGGNQDASTRVTVNAPPVAQAPPPSISDEDLFAQNVKDVLFDYDKSDIRQDQAMNATSDAQFLAQHPSIKFVVEGHCDERGSEEYNLALGTHRAESLKHSLMQEGVSEDRIKTVSYGKEKPFCTENNEGCWQQNRVDHFSFAR